jgi:YVTN family beta-propeller protein
LAISGDGRRTYVVGERSVSVIDTASNTTIATISVPVLVGGQIALTPDGRYAYVTKSGRATLAEPDHRNVVVIDTADNAVAAVIPVGGLPQEVVVTPDGRHAYVMVATDRSGYQVEVIDTASNAVTATIHSPDDATSFDATFRQMTMTADGSFIHVIDSPMVLVISTASNVITEAVSVDSGIVDPAAIAPDGRYIYTATYSGTSWRQSFAVVKVDTGSGTVAATIPLDVTDFIATSSPLRGITVAPDGRYVYVLFVDRLQMIDTVSGTSSMIARLPVISGSSSTAYQSLVVAPDGRYVYASLDCDYSDSCLVAAIDVGR